MKILQLIQTLDPQTGGVARAVTSLSSALVRAGHHVEVVALDKPNAPWLAQTDFNVHALGVGLTNYSYSTSLSAWLQRSGGQYDHVIVNGLWQHLSFAAWRRYAGTSIPYYVFAHGMLDPWFKRTFPLKHLKKWLYWPWADYRVLRDARAVIFTSEEERLAARESFWLYRCRERVSPLGVETPTSLDSAPNRFLEKFPELRERRILLFLGRIHPKKGCDLLLEAFAQLPRPNDPCTLVLAGPDQIDWTKTLRARASDLGLHHVLFPGMLEGELKQGAFAAADAFVLPSHQENFGMAVAEALAVGLPVLISNRVNIWREIAADEAGFVEDDDLAGVIRLIQRWQSTSPETRDTMRENARRCFTERFEIGHAAAQLVRLLEEPAAP